MEQIEMLDKDFKEIILNVKNDILITRNRIMLNANYELINLYFRLGKIISENSKYGTNFIKKFSLALKIDFADMTGISPRNLSRMKTFYEEYKNLSNLPPAVANLPWTHNYLLIERIKNKEVRYWYAQKCYENGWSKVMLNHQIDLELYERQVSVEKLTNFNEILPLTQSELARDILKDPYIFELQGIKNMIKEKDIECAMLERIKNVLLELGNGFSFMVTNIRYQLLIMIIISICYFII